MRYYENLLPKSGRGHLLLSIGLIIYSLVNLMVHSSPDMPAFQYVVTLSAGLVWFTASVVGFLNS